MIITFIVTAFLPIMYGYKNYNNGFDSFKKQIKIQNNKNIGVLNIISRFHYI